MTNSKLVDLAYLKIYRHILLEEKDRLYLFNVQLSDVPHNDFHGEDNQFPSLLAKYRMITLPPIYLKKRTTKTIKGITI